MLTVSKPAICLVSCIFSIVILTVFYCFFQLLLLLLLLLLRMILAIMHCIYAIQLYFKLKSHQLTLSCLCMVVWGDRRVVRG